MKAYLAGPIFGRTYTEKKAWRNTIRERLPDWEFIDPVDFGYHPEDFTEHYKDIVNGDIDSIHQADIILAYMDRPSIGTSMELWYASRIGKPIVLQTRLEHPWLMYTATIIVPTVERLARAVSKIPIDRTGGSGVLLGTTIARYLTRGNR